MFSQFLASLNQTYIVTHGLVEKGEIYETKLLRAIDELKKSAKLRKKLAEEAKAASEAKATLEEELTKLKMKNADSKISYREVNKTSKSSNVTMPTWFREAGEGS